MKIFLNYLNHFGLIIITSVCCNNLSFGQEKVNISVGAGIPELLNVGLRYQFKQTQIGIGLGSMPKSDGSIISVYGDFYYHFAKLSKFSNRKVWYGKIGLNYLREENDYFIEKYVYLNLRVGRDFNISKKMGVQIDAGAIFQLYDEEIRKIPPSGFGLDLNFPVLPSLGIGLFYRI